MEPAFDLFPKEPKALQVTCPLDFLNEHVAGYKNEHSNVKVFIPRKVYDSQKHPVHVVIIIGEGGTLYVR